MIAPGFRHQLDGPDTPTDRLDPGVSFAVLGNVAILDRGRDVAPTARKPLQLLALLLSRPGHVVPGDVIVDELWGEHPPHSARSTIQTYVYQLRRLLGAQGLTPEPDAVLVSKPPGYLLAVDARRVDATVFTRLADLGRAQLEDRSPALASATLRAALEVWSGAPMTDVEQGVHLNAVAVDLMEQRRAVRHLRIEADIAQSRHRALVGELRSLAARDPFDETVHGQLIRVLALCGRRTDAVEVYRDLSDRLTDELGVGPCDEIRRLYRDVVTIPRPRSAA